MNEYNVRQLACATILQAVKDYFATSERGKNKILKDLRSQWMSDLSNGTSIVVAEQLEKNPKEIKARIQKHKERL
jgi:hypothetical protein